MTLVKRNNTEYIQIEKIMPNPLNPRKDPSIHSSDMQHIIKERGWLTPITAYKQGTYYFILSGHRRWYAAKEIGVKEIPVFIVEKPENPDEEVRQIAALQGGRSDWTHYEWAKFIYESWSKSTNKNVKDFARGIDQSYDKVKQSIRAISFFKPEEIENKLNKGIYNPSILMRVSAWVVKVEKNHPELYSNLGVDWIRKTMLRKLDNKKINAESLNGCLFIEKASTEEVKEFLIDSNGHLKDYQKKYGVRKVSGKSKFGLDINKILKTSEIIEEIECGSPLQEKEILNALKILENTIRRTKQKIKEKG
jgi:ParB family transcriptional regulator, chromosome partitioning protein